MVGIAFNTSMLDEEARTSLLAQTEDKFGLPCFDPLKTSLDAVTRRIREL
jgi:uncharacterized NAD-dependent epimerase/dehydratase family protein